MYPRTAFFRCKTRTIPPGPVESGLDKIVSNSRQLLILWRIIHHRYSGTAQLARIDIIAPSSATRQHQQVAIINLKFH